MSEGLNDVLDDVDDTEDWGAPSEFFDDAFPPDLSSPDGESEAAVAEPLIERLRVVFWDFHQPYIAWALLFGLICMGSFFLIKSYQLNGLVDIGQAAPIETRFQVDINSAEIGEIVVLPGVGRRLAGAIIEYRQSIGQFDSHESLCDVPGIGEKKLEAMRPFLLPIKDSNE